MESPRLKRAGILFWIVIAVGSITLSGCMIPLLAEWHDRRDSALDSYSRRNAQKPFQEGMVLPDHNSDSFSHDTEALSGSGRGKRRSPALSDYWGELLDSSMVALRYDYAAALCLSPRGSDAHLRRGLLLDILGIDDLAALEYDEAIKQDPTDARSYNNRGNLSMLMGYPHFAIGYFSKAIELDPSRADPYYNRGRALERLGDLTGAQKDYQKAVELGICDKLPSLKICRKKRGCGCPPSR